MMTIVLTGQFYLRDVALLLVLVKFICILTFFITDLYKMG